VSVALVVITDGRWRYLERALLAASHFIRYPFTHLRLVDDSGSRTGCPSPKGFEIFRHAERRGFAAAVQTAWRALPPEIEYVFHLEEDFVLTESLNVDAMAGVLGMNPRLAQLVLKRQPSIASPAELAAGGILEMDPDLYTDRDGWVEHRRLFSLNPCLVPRHITDRGWPSHAGEAQFTQTLLADGYYFGFWGKREDSPRCMHIGDQRSVGWRI
jgi:hypothetical protein